MKKHKQKQEEEENLEFVPSLKPADDDITSFKQRPEKKPNGNATLGDILRQPGDPEEVPKPPSKSNSNIMPLVFLSAGWVLVLGIVSGVLFSKLSVLEQQLLAPQTESEAQLSPGNIPQNTAAAADLKLVAELQKQVKRLQNLVDKRNKSSIANNTSGIKNLTNTTKEAKAAIDSLVMEVEQLKTVQRAGGNSKSSAALSNAGLKKLEKKQKSLEKSLALELSALKALEVKVKKLSKQGPITVSGGGASSKELSTLQTSLATLEKKIKANDTSIQTIETQNDQLKRSLSLLRAESARVYRLVESSLNTGG